MLHSGERRADLRVVRARLLVLRIGLMLLFVAAGVLVALQVLKPAPYRDLLRFNDFVELDGERAIFQARIAARGARYDPVASTRPDRYNLSALQLDLTIVHIDNPQIVRTYPIPWKAIRSSGGGMEFQTGNGQLVTVRDVTWMPDHQPDHRTFDWSEDGDGGMSFTWLPGRTMRIGKNILRDHGFVDVLAICFVRVLAALAIIACGWIVAVYVSDERFWVVVEHGRCRQCGYSCQGIESKKCPECGHDVR